MPILLDGGAAFELSYSVIFTGTGLGCWGIVNVSCFRDKRPPPAIVRDRIGDMPVLRKSIITLRLHLQAFTWSTQRAGADEEAE